jgi:hypothetical protein
VVRGDALRNGVWLRCALRLEEEEGARGDYLRVERLRGGSHRWRAVTCFRRRREVMGVL